MAKNVDTGIKKLGPGLFRIEVHVRDRGRKQETFEGTIYDARERRDALKRELKGRGTGKNGQFKTVGDVLNHYKVKVFQDKSWYKSSSFIMDTFI